MRLSMLFNLYLLLLGNVANACGSSELQNEVKDSVSFEILDKEVRILRDDPKFELSVALANYSDQRLLIYSFARLEEAFAEDPIYTSGNNVIGNAIFVYSSEDGQIIPEYFVSEEIDYEPMTTDSIINIHNRLRSEVKDSFLLVDPESVTKLKLPYKFKYHELEKGEYEMYLIYYSGENLLKYLSEAEIETDEDKYDASAFRGWVKSNTVKLVVE